MRVEDSIRIIFGADDRYAMPIAVAICSILENLKESDWFSAPEYARFIGGFYSARLRWLLKNSVKMMKLGSRAAVKSISAGEKRSTRGT
ncbi:MAG: hypothetical protein WD355_07800 [Balneolaceae bacterium]